MNGNTADMSYRKLSVIIVYVLFFAVLNETVFTVSTPNIAHHYGLLPSQVSWMVTVFILTFSIGQVIFGKLADRYELRHLMIAGSLIYILASLLGFVLQNWYSIIILDRAIQGIGASALKALSLVVVARCFTPDQRAKLFGIFTSIEACAMAMGPVIGGYISTYLHWSFLFFIPLFLLPMVPLFRRLPNRESDREAGKVDFIGASILSGSIAFIVVFCTHPQWYYLLLGAIGACWFWIHIQRASNPFVAPELFRISRYVAGLMICFVVIGIVMGIVFVYPIFISDLYRLETDRIGVLMLPGAVCSVLFGIAAGLMTAKRGSRLAFYIGYLLILTALIGMTIVIGRNVAYTSASLALLYAGLAFAQTSLSVTITRTLPASQVGIGMGFFGLCVGVASAIGTAAISKLLSIQSSAGSVLGEGANSYKLIFLLAAILVGLTGIVYAFQFRQKESPPRDLKLGIVFIIVLLLSAQGGGVTHADRNDDAFFSEVDAYVAREMKRQNLPGVALGIVKGEHIVYLKGYGQADPSGRPVTPETPFGIGSISKSFTAMAVLQLAEIGEIDLDAPVQRYIPAFQAKVTVRQLLNQTSGFTQMSTYANTLTSSYGQDALAKNALAYAQRYRKPANEQAQAYRYSNANYILLGYIVQQVSGQSYGDYMKEHIFNPLSMPDSFVTLGEAVDHGLAVPHRRWFGYNVPYGGPYIYIPGDVPAGYLFSSAKDMSHYMIAQLGGGRYGNNAVLSSGSIRLMQTEPVPESYAMGWFSSSIGGIPVIGHPGGSAGFQAHVWMVPEQGLGVVVLANALGVLDTAFPKTHIVSTTRIASGVISLLNNQTPADTGLNVTQKYWLVDGLLFLLSAWLLYATVRTARRCLRRSVPGRPGRPKIMNSAMSIIVLHFAGPFLVLILSVTPVMPLWSIATIYQPDLILWLKIMGVILALKGTMELLRQSERSYRDEGGKRG